MKRFLLLITFCLFSLCAAFPARTLRPYVWVLDAGHGGKDQGTAVNGILEKDLNLKITQELARLIRKNKPGIKLVLTRQKDQYLSLDQRCRIANNARADLFLSIHVNYVKRKPYMRGTETFYASLRSTSNVIRRGCLMRSVEKSELLARLIQKSYQQQGRPCERGAKEARFHVLLNTNMPAALTEVGFLSNSQDAAYMSSPQGQKEIAQNLYRALCEYYETTKAKTKRQTLLALRQSAATISALQPQQPLQQQNEKEEVEKQIEEEEREEEQEKKEEKQPKQEEHPLPVYSIQIVAVSSELKSDDKRLKGLYPVTFVRSGTAFKGLYGGTTSYEQARRTLQEIRDKFPDAFIVAYLGEEQIPTAQALQMSR